MTRTARQIIALSLLAIAVTPAAQAAEPAAALWDMKALAAPPKVTWTEETSYNAKALYFEGEPYKGKPTRVFAYYAVPKNATGKVPAMVLVHGGGGTAFPNWADLWAKRGYAAIAMDLGGCGPGNKRLEDGGPAQTDDEKFDGTKSGVKDAWTYHAVANVIRAHSLIRSLPAVDADRTGLTGISWGGYLTCMTVGVDHRFKVAVPVYGCGFLQDNSVWLPAFKKLGADRTAEWVRHFDPSCLLANCKTPTLWVNGTNDLAYPLDSYKKSYSLVPADRFLCVKVRMPHGHEEGWKPKEIGLFVDGYLAAEKEKPFAKLSAISRTGAEVSATATATVPLKSAALHYTLGKGAWQSRKWETIPAKIVDGKLTATLPAEKGLVFYLNATDERGVTVSTPHEEIE